jgi:hypothetical protein
MNIYIQTRGYQKDQDYAFLGEEPANYWWAEFGELTSFEQPTFILRGERDLEDWQCYMSGIPSKRRDISSTEIRFTLVIEGVKNNPDDELLLSSLVHIWLDDFEKHLQDGILQKTLDSIFDKDTVQTLVDNYPYSELNSDHINKFKSTISTQKTESNINTNIKLHEQYIGRSDSEEAKSAFIQTINHIINNNVDGVALMPNLINESSDLEEIIDQYQLVAVLIRDEKNKLSDPYEKIKKKAPTLSLSTPSKKTRILYPILIGLTIVLFLIFYLIWKIYQKNLILG